MKTFGHFSCKEDIYLKQKSRFPIYIAGGCSTPRKNYYSLLAPLILYLFASCQTMN